MDDLSQLIQLNLHLLHPTWLLLPEECTGNVRFLLLLGNWQSCEHGIVCGELIRIVVLRAWTIGCSRISTVRFVEEDVIRIKHEQDTAHPVNVNILLLDPLHQCKPTRTIYLSLHSIQQLLLQLLLGRRFRYSHRMDFCKTRHENVPSNDCVHEFNATNATTLSWHEELMTN